jgi:hypothetical protein
VGYSSYTENKAFALPGASQSAWWWWWCGLQLTWNDDGELGNLELVDINDIQLEFSD